MLEPILKGLVEWLYEIMISIMAYASGELIGVMSMDLTYFRNTAPIISDIVNVFIALGWALLIGNLVFQSLKAIVSGIGFEAEDPKILFLRTFVFGFLLLASREICEIGLSITGSVINVMGLPTSISVTTPDESMFSLGSDAKWLLVIIVGVVLMLQMIKLLFEIGERYVITSVLTFFAPLAFAMGGSKNTNDIFKGWCRMYASMLVMMIMNIVFLKLIMSAMSRMAAGGVLVWLVFVVALTRVARKIDSHIGKIGLNPAQTGNELGSRLPGMMTMVAIKTMGSLMSRSMANAKGGSGGKSGNNGRTGRNGSGSGRGRNSQPNPYNPVSGSAPIGSTTNNPGSAYGGNTNAAGVNVNNGGALYAGNGGVNVSQGGANTNVVGAANRGGNMDSTNISNQGGQGVSSDNRFGVPSGNGQNVDRNTFERKSISRSSPLPSREHGKIENHGISKSGDKNNVVSRGTVPRGHNASNPASHIVSGGAVNHSEKHTSSNEDGVSAPHNITENVRPPISRNTSVQQPNGIINSTGAVHSGPSASGGADVNVSNNSHMSHGGNASVIKNAKVGNQHKLPAVGGHGVSSHQSSAVISDGKGKTEHHANSSVKVGGDKIGTPKNPAVTAPKGGSISEGTSKVKPGISNGAMNNTELHKQSTSSGLSKNISSSTHKGGENISVHSDRVNTHSNVNGSIQNGGNSYGGNVAEGGSYEKNISGNGSSVHMVSTNVGGSTNISSEHMQSERFSNSDNEHFNSQHTDAHTFMQSRKETSEQRINHEYKHGRYNPAAANKKVKQSYYRKDSQQGMTRDKHPYKMRGDTNRKQRKK